MTTTWVALLRGINVGGRNRVAMVELREALTGAGLSDVRTYIQSGNVVFDTADSDLDRISVRISAKILKNHGFEPRVLLLESAELERAIARNPFPEAVAEPKTLHLLFLETAPEHPDLEGLESVRAERERFELDDCVFYLHAPDGIGRSRLAERVERLLGVPATARNWRSVQKIRELAEG